jgi:hypothetical protein
MLRCLQDLHQDRGPHEERPRPASGRRTHFRTADLWAREHGYAKLQNNLLGMQAVALAEARQSLYCDGVILNGAVFQAE